MQAIIFVGIQATGKSSFYRQRFLDTHVHINLDLLKTRRREQVLLEACLAGRQSFVVDNTNATRAARARYIAPARAAGFGVAGYYFRISLRDALERNRSRPPGVIVPEKGIIAMYYRLQAPEPDEGFDELYEVSSDPAGSFTVRDWAGGN